MKKFIERTRVVGVNMSTATIMAEVLRDLGIEYNAWIAKSSDVVIIAFKSDLPTYNLVESLVDADVIIEKFRTGRI